MTANTISKNPETRQVRKLASAVGDFMRYWGFRRIHGQIWTEIFLSREPLSLTDLTRLLRVSKALVSPALGELEGYGLIRVAGGDAKTRKYAADPDFFAVIRKVLRQREKVLIKKAEAEFEELKQVARARKSEKIDFDRLEQLGQLIESGAQAIDFIIAATEEQASSWDDLIKEARL